MQQKLFQFFLPQEDGAFGYNRKGTAKVTPKSEKIMYRAKPPNSGHALNSGTTSQ